MRTTLRSILFCLLISITIVLLLPVINSSFSYAAPGFTLEETDVTFDGSESGNPYAEKTIFVTAGSGSVSYTESNDTSIAKVTHASNCIMITPEGPGETTIEVHGINSEETTDIVYVTVHVTSGWIKAALKYTTDIDNNYYGRKAYQIHTLAGATGELKVGGDTYSFTADSHGNAKITLKKLYKLNSKIVVTVTLGEASLTCNYKVRKNTYVDTAKVRKKAPKTIKLNCYSLTKGDVVQLTYKGKHYKKTIKKNYKPGTRHTVTIKVKSKFKKSSSMTVVIKNKYKQTVSKQRVKLYKWFFDKDYDPDDINS